MRHESRAPGVRGVVLHCAVAWTGCSLGWRGNVGLRPRRARGCTRIGESSQRRSACANIEPLRTLRCTKGNCRGCCGQEVDHSSMVGEGESYETKWPERSACHLYGGGQWWRVWADEATASDVED